MAEENVNDQSLGFDLGSELTGANPTPNIQSPFDVKIPEPQYGQQIRKLESLDTSLNNEEYQNLLDDVETGNLPNPDIEITDPLSIEASRKNIRDSFKFGPKNETDPFGLENTLNGDFRDPKKQNTFYNRYKEHGDFNELGFSPYRNNEEYYNENTSTFGDLGRATGQWWELAKLGFGDMLGVSDLDSLSGAKRYAEASAIGSSTKDGLGAFGVNTFLNSGYTMGIIGEMVLEEAALVGVEALAAAAVPFTLGASATVNVAAGARMAYTAQKGVRRISGAFKQAKKMRKMMDAMQDANKARSFFTKTMNFINPLENTTSFLKNVNKMDDISKLTKTVRGAGGFIRDMRGIRGTWNEAVLEANMVQDDMHSAMLDDFRAKHGRGPNQDEAKRMLSSIKAASASTALWNSALIGVTNKFTLGPLLRPLNRGMGMGLFDLAKTGRKFVQQSYKKGAPEAYKLLSRNFITRSGQLLRNPKALLGKSLLYSSDNFAEGFQEVGQEAIAGWQKEFHQDQFKGNEIKGGYYAYLADNIENQISPEGFETFMSGFLMQKFVSPFIKTGSALTRGSNYSSTKDFFTNREKWREDRKANDTKAEDLVNKLNQYYKNPENYFSSDLMAAVKSGEYAKILAQSETDGDIKSYYDVKDDSMFDAFNVALETGRLGSILKQLEGLKDLTEEEVQQEYNMDQSTFHNVIDNSVSRAKHIEKLRTGFSNKFNNPVDYKQYKYGTPERAEAYMNHVAWQKAISDITYNSYSFTRALERTESILGKVAESTGLENIPVSELTNIFSTESVNKEMLLLDQEISSIEQSGKLTESVKKQIKQKKDKKKKLAELQSALKSIDSLTENESVDDGIYDIAKKAYRNYMSSIADTYGQTADFSNLDDSFHELLDYYKLKGRSKKLQDTVNQMLDPENFLNRYSRIKQVVDEANKNRYEEIKKSYLEYMKGSTTDNQLLNSLADIGVFIDIDDFKKLIKDGVFPDALYYTDPKQGGEYEVPMNSDLFKKAVGVLSEYADIKDNIPLTEFKEKYNIYTLRSRAKKQDDKRTYNDIAAQFGFNPNLETDEVQLTKVLQSIIDSEYSDIREKELAKILLAKATPEEMVTFSKNSGLPAKYTDGKNVVNPKFSSNNYKEGKLNSPIEYFILNGEIQRKVNDALLQDKTFNATLTALMNEAKEKWDSLSDQEKMNYGGNMLALESVEAFAADAMTNKRVQAFLTQVKTNKATEKSLWNKFLDAILANLKSIFELENINGTVLNATINVITTKIDPASTAKAKEAEETTGTTEAVNRDMSIANIRIDHPELLDALIDSYIEFNNKNVKLGDKSLIPEGSTRDEISKLPVFAEYVSNRGYTSPEDVFDKYNKELGAQTETGPEMTTSTESVSDIESKADIEKSLEIDGVIPEFGEHRPNEPYVDDDGVNRVRAVAIRTRTVTKKIGGKEYQFDVQLYEDGKAIYTVHSTKVQEGGALKVLVVDQTLTESEYNDLFNQEATKAKPAAKVEPSAEVTFVAPKSGIKTRAVKAKLIELGFNPAEIDAMSNKQAYSIANENETKDAKELRLKSENLDEENDNKLSEQREEARSEISSIINSPSNYQQYLLMLDTISAMIDDLSNDVFPISQFSLEDLDNLYAEKLKSLAEDVKFDELIKGEVVMVERKNKDGKPYLVSVKVSDKDKDSVTLEYLNPGKNGKINSFKVMKDKTNSDIKYKYSEALENSDLDNATTVSEEEMENAKVTVEKLDDLEDTNTLNEDMEDAKNKSQEELDQELIEELENNCK